MPTTVFLLYEDDGVNYAVVGVFSTKDLADDALKTLNEKDATPCHRYVDEVELDT